MLIKLCWQMRYYFSIIGLTCYSFLLAGNSLPNSVSEETKKRDLLDIFPFLILK